MIKGYSVPLLGLKDLHFVTLTSKNVTGDLLDAEVDKFNNGWRRKITT